MSDYDPREYGEGCAAFYDQLYPTIEPGLLSTLSDLARGGSVLELGLATGRVARRLNEAGLLVHGVDASRAMVVRCRALPGASGLRIVLGDLASLPYSGQFSLVFALVNTLSLLPSRLLLSRCLASVAENLAPSGVFVYETYPMPESAVATSEVHSIRTVAGMQSYRVTALGTPLEAFDRLAASVGLQLLEVWRDWRRNAATDPSTRRILVYGRASVNRE